MKKKGMGENDLIVFQYNRKTNILITVLIIIILITCFFAYCLIAYIAQPTNKWLIVITFFGLMFGVTSLLNRFLSTYAYKEIGKLICSESKITVYFTNNTLNEYSSNQINNLRFNYQGDYEWRALNPRFQKSKSRDRYRIKRSSYGSELRSFDKITINSNEYLIKIRSFVEKEYFYKIVEWAKIHDIKFELIEEKYYAKFK